jgi:hypothetical protein
MQRRIAAQLDLVPLQVGNLAGAQAVPGRQQGSASRHDAHGGRCGPLW